MQIYRATPDLRQAHNEVIEFCDEEIERLHIEIVRKLGYKPVDHRLELHAVPIGGEKKKR